MAGNIFTTVKGYEVEVFPVDVMKIKKARDQVKMPKRPTYEVKTPSGNVETWPLDEESAAQTPGALSRWQWYLEQRREALNDQNDKIARTIFYYGTYMLELPADDWERKQLANGFEIPQDPDLKRAHYLATELNANDLSTLISRIMLASGVSEEEIADAVDTFRDPVQA